MKKMIKTIALAATCAIAGTGCVSLGAAQNEVSESYFSGYKKLVDSFYESKTLVGINFGLGALLAIMQLQDTENKNNKEHAAITLIFGSLPLAAKMTGYDKNSTALPMPLLALSCYLNTLKNIFNIPFIKGSCEAFSNVTAFYENPVKCISDKCLNWFPNIPKLLPVVFFSLAGNMITSLVWPEDSNIKKFNESKTILKLNDQQ